MQQTKLVVTMNAKMAGITKVINRCSFVDGKFEFIGSMQDCNGLARYLDASFNCNVWMGPPTANPIFPEAAPAPVVEEVTPEDLVNEDEEITEREQKILDAINCVDLEAWVDDVVAHPSVSTIAELIEDSTVTKEEIVAVIENWMEDDAEAEEEAPADEDKKD